MANYNILSERYATPEINKIFSVEGTILASRNLWIAVMKSQKDLGVDIPSEAIKAYEDAKMNINLDRIKEIEENTRHDVKANIEAFNEVANGYEHIHKGMTSRDVTDNVEQAQIRKAGDLICNKYISVLRHLIDKSNSYSDVVLTARTHHQPAQPTLLGRRFSMWAEELLLHIETFDRFISDYPFRGIKGPVGTQADMLTLLGSEENVATLEKKVAEQAGFKKVLSSPGQVYPRSLDYQLISNLALLSAAPENFAHGMRLMAGYDLVTEGFTKEQTGSSAMPHKRNTRSSERIVAEAELIKMYAEGASRISGHQWEEGDVSCSAIRRVIIPDAIYASDGLCETILTVLNEMGPYPRVIEKELEKNLPFLATTDLLTAAVQNGMGREKAYDKIKKASMKAAEKIKLGKEGNHLLDILSNSDGYSIGLNSDRISSIIKNKRTEVGNAKRQIEEVTAKVTDIITKYPEAAQYEPQPIL